MSRAKIVFKVDPSRTVTDASVEQLLRQVVEALVPHLREQIGAVDCRHGDQSGTSWTTEGWLEDGTYLLLSVGVGSGEVILFIDTSPVLKAVTPVSTRRKVGLATAAGVGGLVSWWQFRSSASVLGGIVIGLILGTVVEILVTMRRERFAAAWVIDEEGWRNQLVAAVASGG